MLLPVQLRIHSSEWRRLGIEGWFHVRTRKELAERGYSYRVHTWGEEKDNDDNYGDDVEVMLL